MAAQHPRPPLWEVKHSRGGLVDAEFIAQYLMLRHAADHPEVIQPNTSAALAALAQIGAIDEAAASEIMLALALWRQVQGVLKLVLDEPLEVEAAPPALKAVLARGADAVDFGRLKVDMIAAAATVLQHYRTLIETPAEQARTRLPKETER
jgi:glutamate-ammonia-ligase adenylyltransferase